MEEEGKEEVLGDVRCVIIVPREAVRQGPDIPVKDLDHPREAAAAGTAEIVLEGSAFIETARFHGNLHLNMSAAMRNPHDFLNHGGRRKSAGYQR